MLGQRAHHAGDPVPQLGGVADVGHHPLEQPLDGRSVLLFDRPHQVGLGAEVIAHRGVVALSRGLADLPVRHGEDAVFRVQPFGRLQDRLLCAARPIGAHSSGRRHPLSQLAAPIKSSD